MSRVKRGVDIVLLSSRSASIKQEMLYTMMQVILVAMVGVMLFLFINNKASDLGFERRFIAKDLGMTVTALYASPGNTLLHYKPPIDELSGNVSLLLSMGGPGYDTRVFVKQSDKPKLNPPLAYYARDAEVPPFWMEEKEYDDDFYLFRFGYTLEDDVERTNVNRLSCPSITWNEDNSEWDKNKKIHIDVTKEGDDIVSKREAEVGEQVKISLTNQNRVPLSEDSNVDVDIGVRILRDSDPGAIRAYILESSNNIKEDRTLACSLINELLTRHTVVSYVQIIPVAEAKESWLSMLELSKSKYKVILEFGVMEKSQIDYGSSSTAIYNALSRFFGSEMRLSPGGATISANLVKDNIVNVGKENSSSLGGASS